MRSGAGPPAPDAGCRWRSPTWIISRRSTTATGISRETRASDRLPPPWRGPRAAPATWTRAQALGWEAIRNGRHTLIAAPTGSGKTLAAFLTVLDDLVQDGLRGPLAAEVRVVYVSPLKALSADIHKNLAEPRRGIRALAE